MANLDLGDNGYGDADSVTLTSDGTGAAGDFVTFDANGDLTPTSATSDDIVGVLAEDSPDAAGDSVRVHLQGAVVANVATGVSAGEWLSASGTAGQADAVDDSTGGSVHTIDYSRTGTETVHFEQPRALEDEDGDNSVLVKLP